MAVNQFKGVWCGLVPHRVEMLTWFIIMGRLNTKDRLKKLNIIRDGEVFCQEDLKIIHHLYFSCQFSWAI